FDFPAGAGVLSGAFPAGQIAAVEQRLMVELGDVDVSELELPPLGDLGLKADIAAGGLHSVDFPSRPAVDGQLGSRADDLQPQLVPLARFRQPAALGARQVLDVAFFSLFQVGLVPAGPRLARGRRLRAEVDARVPSGVLASAPFEFQYEIAIVMLGPHQAVAFLQHEQSVFDAGLAARHDPAFQVAAIEQAHRKAFSISGNREGGLRRQEQNQTESRAVAKQNEDSAAKQDEDSPAKHDEDSLPKQAPKSE